MTSLVLEVGKYYKTRSGAIGQACRYLQGSGTFHVRMIGQGIPRAYFSNGMRRDCSDHRTNGHLITEATHNEVIRYITNRMARLSRTVLDVLVSGYMTVVATEPNSIIIPIESVAIWVSLNSDRKYTRSSLASPIHSLEQMGLIATKDVRNSQSQITYLVSPTPLGIEIRENLLRYTHQVQSQTDQMLNQFTRSKYYQEEDSDDTIKRVLFYLIENGRLANI